jgi:hypothetical protein
MAPQVLRPRASENDIHAAPRAFVEDTTTAARGAAPALSVFLRQWSQQLSEGMIREGVTVWGKEVGDRRWKADVGKEGLAQG